MDEADFIACFELTGSYLKPRITIAFFLALILIGAILTYLSMLSTFKILLKIPFKAILTPTLENVDELTSVPALLGHLIFWITAGYLSLRFLFLKASFKLVYFTSDWMIHGYPARILDLQCQVEDLEREVRKLRETERVFLRFMV